MAMLKRRESSDAIRILQNRIWQDLHVLVAEIQMGSIVRPGEPSYALLSKATQTIQSFLESLRVDRVVEQPETHAVDEWFPHWSPDPWNLEIGFWQDLAEHPFIAGAEPGLRDS